jgi:hypothetical protein
VHPGTGAPSDPRSHPGRAQGSGDGVEWERHLRTGGRRWGGAAPRRACRHGHWHHSARGPHTVVVQNTLVGGVNDAAIHVLARMLHAPVLVRPEYGAHTPIVILLGSDVPTAR